MTEPTRDEWAEIMEEAPGGLNHGRRRSAGGWWSLEEDVSRSFQDGLTIEEFEPPKRRPNKPDDTIRHGTLAAYQNDGCRCELCRESKRSYMRVWRAMKRQSSDPSDTLPEEDL